MESVTGFPKRVLVEAWECSLGHRHSTREIAQACEIRLTEVAERVRLRRNALRLKLGAIVEMRESKGMVFRQIGEQYGVGPSRARDLYLKACRMRKNPRFRGFEAVEGNQ